MTQTSLLGYDIISRIGHGAGSTIYAATDPRTGQLYAVKHVVCETAREGRLIEQLEAEFDLGKSLVHPNLRRVYDLKLSRSMFRRHAEGLLVMELVDGHTLAEQPPSSIREIVQSFLQVAQGLQAMHGLGLVHCDLKPNNIMRTDGGGVKLIDFGQSCRVGTIKQRIQGTPDFIAPEQMGKQPVTVLTDVYNLGATMYAVLTGKPIPTAYTSGANGRDSFLLPEIMSSPRDLNTLVPVGLSKLVMESVALSPARRPEGMPEIISRLELALHVLDRTGGLSLDDPHTSIGLMPHTRRARPATPMAM
jgi:serine/threonine-protein kinase